MLDRYRIRNDEQQRAALAKRDAHVRAERERAAKVLPLRDRTG